MNPFATVYFDIVGTCNARCPYCQTGAERRKTGPAIPVVTFAAAVDALLRARAVGPGSVIGLYNWGEPFLHPDLRGIVEELNRRNLRYSLSTNASRIPAVDRGFVRNLDHVIFSMCGFSQAAYDRIHGLEFRAVRDNIVRFTRACRKEGFRGDFLIAFHGYRFNLGELRVCESFASRHGILFRPYPAILNHWEELSDYIAGTLPKERVHRIEGDLLGMEAVRETMRRAPVGYRCQQLDYLVITEEAEVLGCCQLPKGNPEYSCGNLLRDGFEDIMARKERLPICEGCLRSGLAWYINHSLSEPTGYRRSLLQRLIRLGGRARRLGAGK